MQTVEKLMTDLDATIAGELAVLQARGASRQEIELRHRDLNAWAMDQCARAESKIPQLVEIGEKISAELAIVRAMWARCLPAVEAAIKAGSTLAAIWLCRCEDGHGIHMDVVFAEQPDLYVYSGGEFTDTFTLPRWRWALKAIAADYGAEVDVIDLRPGAVQAALAPAGPWTRII